MRGTASRNESQLEITAEPIKSEPTEQQTSPLSVHGRTAMGLEANVRSCSNDGDAGATLPFLLLRDRAVHSLECKQSAEVRVVELEDAKEPMKLTVKMHSGPITRGKHFLQVHPGWSRAWIVPALANIVQADGMHVVDSDMRQRGCSQTHNPFCTATEQKMSELLQPRFGRAEVRATEEHRVHTCVVHGGRSRKDGPTSVRSRAQSSRKCNYLTSRRL